ncbi:MAG: dTDP-4-dehydrorhamnose reductase [Archaeoglobaceae archaeon]|nr:dTDP-4-dehydrorhamnose reductase [Archaeoglobaceae archaeon]
MRVLITGASGLLGSKIAEIAVNQGCEVYSAYKDHYPEYGFPVKIDLTDKASCEKAFEIAKPEVVIHSAALTNVDLCEKEKELAWRINVEGTKIVSNLCRNRFLIFVSTDYVFDGERGFYSEEDKPNPINYYGYTKLLAEKAVKELENYAIVRTSVIFGSKPASGKTNFALWVIENLKNERKISVVTDQINSPTLNKNLAEMILEIAERNLKGIYHLAGASAVSRYNFARLIAKEFDLNAELIEPATSDKINWIAKRPRNTSLNVSKALKELKRKPMDIRKALRELRNEMKI